MATLLSLGAVTVAGYRVRTGDQTTAATVVTGALLEAEEMLEEELRRGLPWQERTDTFTIYPGGRVYPNAYPITEASGMTIDGRALYGATADLGTWLAWYPDCAPSRATVTWTGGFDDGSNSQRLPVTLRHAMYDLARPLAADVAPVPVGAVSASVGDVSVTYGDQAGTSSGSVDTLVPGLSMNISRYRHRWV